MIRSFNNCRRHNHLNLNLAVRRFQNEGIRATSATAAVSMLMSMSTPPMQATIRSRGYRNLASSMNNNNLISLSSSLSSSSSSSSSSWSTTRLLQRQQQQQLNRQQLRTVFIQTENTPNPESIKFLPTNTVVLDNEDGSGHFLNKSDPIEDILKSPLAKDLFKIDDVKAVYFGYDFVTVTKKVTGKWQFMRPEIFSVLMDFFDNPNNKVVLEQPLITDTTILDEDDEIVAMIKELIEDRIRPAVQEDGGDIHYVNFEEDTGMVTVQLAGSCVGCPSSAITLKNGVENMLMHYIPEVTAVQALEEEPDEDDDDDRNNDDDDEETPFGEEPKKQKSYEERLAAAGIPFSD